MINSSNVIFQDTLQALKPPFIRVFLIYIIVPLSWLHCVESV